MNNDTRIEQRRAWLQPAEEVDSHVGPPDAAIHV